MEKQILYHGSNVIVEHPLVSIGRKDLDFGPGFYLTPLFEQLRFLYEEILAKEIKFNVKWTL